ncbi:MAG: N-glycosylase/DNA lyase [Candidatus Bathyarchaeia archaeon]
MQKQLINYERVNRIADLLSRLGFDGIIKFDCYEPEYIALKKIFNLNIEPKFLGLIALSAGTIDFQLGFGGAERFWGVLHETAKEAIGLNSIENIKGLMMLFLNNPVNARCLEVKKERIKKIFSKDFANWYIDNYEYLRENPEKLWKKLAQVLRSPMNKKTIVFSMKAFDIANLICYGDYLPFPQNIPIPVDFHVKHVTISSGLLNQYYDDELFRNVWSLVLNNVKYNLDRNITLLRLDSIVWQIGKLLYKCGYKRELSQKSVEEYLTRKICIEKNLAKEIATELTRFIDNV